MYIYRILKNNKNMKNEWKKFEFKIIYGILYRYENI